MFCHNCGARRSENATFCGKCGVKHKINDHPDSDVQLIKHYFNRGMKYSTILFVLHKNHAIELSMRTLKRRLKMMGLNKSSKSKESQARSIISSELSAGPSTQLGYRGMWNKLRVTYGVNLPRDTVMKILQELDPEGCKERRKRKLYRRTYMSLGPNSVWHADGYDKLKPYGLPVHGCIDGFSRHIIWLKVVRSNNNPTIPATLFLKSIERIGFAPKHLYTDCGTENGIMAAFQCFIMDDLEAHKYGSSQRNQRIENWWSHFRRSYTNWIINFFKEMVQDGILLLNHTVHMECVWYVFSQFLQNELDMITKEWNNHLIRKSSFTEVTGVPFELYNAPELLGYSNQGIEIAPEKIEAIVHASNVYADADAALSVEDPDLMDYFRYVVQNDGLTHPPRSWIEAKQLFIHIIDCANIQP